MKLDEFESVFRSSLKIQFQFKAPKVKTGIFISGLDSSHANVALKNTNKYLSHGHAEIEWSCMHNGDFNTVSDILDRVRRNPPDLVACSRHVLGQGDNLPYSLGSTVDTLTQATDIPVLLLPTPSNNIIELPKHPSRVMAVTNHLTGDHRLINWAAHFCTDDGTLHLGHVEDQEAIKTFLEVCSKIPGINIDLVREKVPTKLLDLPRDYIHSTAQVLSKHKVHDKVQEFVKVGDPVKDYQQYVREHEIDLLVMNTKDTGQSAMHGLAYALAVEIRNRPLLLL